MATISEFFPRVFVTRRRAVLGVLIAIAVVNLGAGVVLARLPGRQADLDTVRVWSRQWLVDGTNIYAAAEYFPDYPPNAIVFLSPLGLLPHAIAVVSWTCANIALSVIAPYLAFRAIRPDLTWAAAALPVTLCLAWGGFRTLLQFTSLALVLGLAAMVFARARPAAAGLCLGLALFKPQVAMPFLLWAAFMRQWRLLAVAMVSVAAGIAIFCARAMVSPTVVIDRYIAILRFYYFGDGLMVGASELRPLFALALSDFRGVDIGVSAAALTLLLVVAVAGVLEIRRCRAVYFAAPPLAGLWCLLVFYHLTYGFIILLPLAAAMVLSRDQTTLLARQIMFWVLYVTLVVDVPTLMRLLGPVVPVPAISDLLSHFDRGLFLALFAGVAMLVTKCHN